MKLSVVIASHNSRLDFLNRVLVALRMQTLAAEQWELILIDNASRIPIEAKLDLSDLKNARIIRNEVPESEASLVDARSIGIKNSKGDVIVFVDDDNVLEASYLYNSLEIAKAWPALGSWGGCIQLEYEDTALKLPPELEPLLCCREIFCPIWSNIKSEHTSTPWGAGLCVRREVGDAYLHRLNCEPDRRRLDPVGAEMRFGGDTDLVYTGLLLGFGKGVFPELRLVHLIPPKRCDITYIHRALRAHGYSSALHHWLDTGEVCRPSLGTKFWIKELIAWFSDSRLNRQCKVARRTGEWLAYHELKDRKPRIVGNWEDKFK